MRTPSLAKTLRRTPTPFEIRFWRLIHPLRQAGWHFRRQAPMGRYVVDFVCHHAKLIIEIDGDSHFSDAGMAHDATRTAFLAAEGYHVLRFTNLEVMQQDEAVYAAVVEALDARGPTPPGLPHQEGGDVRRARRHRGHNRILET